VIDREKKERNFCRLFNEKAKIIKKHTHYYYIYVFHILKRFGRGGIRASPARFGPARMWPVKKRAGTGQSVK